MVVRRLALLAVAVLICCGLAHGASALPSDVVAAYGTDREQSQWRYWITKEGYDLDRRLDQTVSIEIVGRALIPALVILSEKTGVSLQVASDALSTLGERKLTVIAQKSSLKAIMVQMPMALQECHWSIDWTGAQPVYSLQWDRGGVDPEGRSQQEAARQAEQAAKRAQRLEDVKRALAMSPEQLKELGKDDLFLARSMQEDPEARSDAALFVTLPPDQLQKFIDSGRVQPRYADLPAPVKAGFEQLLKRMTTDPNLTLGLPDYTEQEIFGLERERIGRWRENPDARVDFVDTGAYFGVGVPDDFLTFPILPKFPTEQSRYEAVSILNRGGTPDTRAAANEIVSQWIDKGRVQAQEWDSSQQKTGQVPTDPDLLRSARLVSSGRTELAQIQREIAAQTGLSLLSDYFSERPVAVSGSLSQPMPLWRLLNAVAADSNCMWRKVGYYVVFHHAEWAGLAAGEIPESLLTRYRGKVAEVGHLTIADAAEFAAAWEGKPGRAYGIPMDLQDAGLNYPCPCLLLYASLTPEQIAAAHRPAGLPCRELLAAQRQHSARTAYNGGARPRPTTDEVAKSGSLHIEEIVAKPGAGPGGTTVRIFIQLGDKRPPYPTAFVFPEMKTR